MKNNKATIQDVLDFIKLPANFSDLHDLKKVSEAASVARGLLSNLETFYRNYVMSFLIEGKDIKSYIAESEQHLYKGLKKFSKDEHTYFIIDTINKEIIPFFASRSNMAFVMDDDNNNLLMLVKDEHHSPFSRPHKKIILGAAVQVYTFCVSTNKFLSSKRSGLGKSDYEADIRSLIPYFVSKKEQISAF
jgi:hypothetical protein